MKRLRFSFAVLAGALLTGGCASDVNPLRDAYVGAGMPSRQAKPADFVAESRTQASGEFLPVGVSAPQRPIRAKSSEGAKALEAELEGARSRNEAQGRAAASAGRAAAPPQ
ncbi:hypothetical protein [Methylobacterium iners]|uniref:DUF3035 domain-containing protein n=1 Tax=Methylobacterium iners TaxID=418707 RepID=A0ABQ4RYV0_9HYPH|nr:hypothetical protein [Methylobacterium iners]GJD95994.1 hypothetical protein OCOJLMKI_3211 [Methylobacterium iners]